VTIRLGASDIDSRTGGRRPLRVGVTLPETFTANFVRSPKPLNLKIAPELYRVWQATRLAASRFSVNASTNRATATTQESSQEGSRLCGVEAGR
jgi:hypothetical protein